MTTDVSAANVAVQGSLYLADISEAIGGLSWDFQVGQVSQFSFPAVDVDGVLSKRGMLRAGRTLTHNGQVWEIAAVERDRKASDVWLSFDARSRFARRLRRLTGPKKWEKATPAQVITSLAKKCGGVALVEPGAKRRTINQRRNQSALDLISALASDTGVEWCEFDGTLYVGTPWWAFQGGTGLPTWGTFADGADPLGEVELPLLTTSMNTRESLDDRAQSAEATLTVDRGLGVQVRPWHRVNITRCDEPDRGLWLVTGVQFDETSDVMLSLSRPLKSAPKKGSTGSTGGTGDAGATGDLSTLDGDWIQGADKTWPGCSRTPRQFVAYALAQRGQGYPLSRCLQWVSGAVSPGVARGGYSARYVWGYAPAGTAKAPGDTNPPIGAIVVWGRGAGSGHGHIGISVGNGRFVSATGGQVVELNIAGFTGDYLGAMVPNFGGSYPQYPGAPGP